jgi:hypothetical protein
MILPEQRDNCHWKQTHFEKREEVELFYVGVERDHQSKMRGTWSFPVETIFSF